MNTKAKPEKRKEYATEEEGQGQRGSDERKQNKRG